jgi:hypothetical protein
MLNENCELKKKRRWIWTRQLKSDINSSRWWQPFYNTRQRFLFVQASARWTSKTTSLRIIAAEQSETSRFYLHFFMCIIN